MPFLPDARRTIHRNRTTSKTIKKNGVFLHSIVTSFLIFLAFQDHVNAFQPTTRTRRDGPQRNVLRFQTNARIHAVDSSKNHYGFSCCHPRGRRLTPIQMRGWDGDDIRWFSRLRRKFLRRRFFDTEIRSSAKTTLIALQVLLYGYQILSTVVTIRRKFPSYWPTHAVEMIVDSIWGSAVVNGPLTNTFGFSAAFAKSNIPYRYITSGFFHSGLLHLLINIGVMSQLQPSWLATGLGGPLYTTTFLGSIVAGNVAHVLNSPDRLFDVTIFLGSSAGICGLFGLMFVCLTRIANLNPSNGGPSSGQMFRGMAIMTVLGLWMDNVNTAMTVGGFFGGVLIGILCGPRYTKDYAMRRKNSAGYDPVSRNYRRVMGFGIMPTDSGLISLKALYGILFAVAISIPKYRNVPFAISRGLMNAL